MLGASRERKHRVEGGDLFCRKASFGQLGTHIVETYLVQLVDGHGDVDNFVGCTNHLGDTGKHLAVVDFHHHIDAQLAENHVDHLHQLELVELRGGANHVGVALIEFSVATLLRPVGTPHRLQLVAAEGEGDLVAMLDNETGEGNGEVIAQATVTNLRCHLVIILLEINILHEVARIEHLEQQFVALFAIFAHERRKVLERRSFDRFKGESAEDRADSVENIVAASHLYREEIARTLGD